MYNKVVNSDLSKQVFMNRKLQDELLLSGGDSSCSFLISRSLALLSVHESSLCWILAADFVNCPCAGYLAYPFHNQEVNSHAGNLNTCAGYLGHPFGKQGSLRRSDVVGRRSERESHDRNAYFGTDNPSSQDNGSITRPSSLHQWPKHLVSLYLRNQACPRPPRMSRVELPPFLHVQVPSCQA